MALDTHRDLLCLGCVSAKFQTTEGITQLVADVRRIISLESTVDECLEQVCVDKGLIKAGVSDMLSVNSPALD